MAGLGRSNSLSINTSGTSLFGNNASGPQQTGSLFGSTTPQPPPSTGLFSNLNKPAAPSAPAAGGGLFGSSTAQTQPQQTGSLFGGALGAGANTQAQTQPSQSGGLFGGSQAPKAALFGGAASTAQQSNAPLFGNSNTQQNQASTQSLFGSNPQQQQQQQQQPPTNSMFPNLQSQNKPLGSLGGTGLSMSTNQAVQIQAADSIKGTTRFNDLSPEFQQQIVQIEEMIQKRINNAHTTRGTLPQHIDQVTTISPDVQYVEKLLSTVELGLDNDSANIHHVKTQVKKDAEDAALSFRAIENQALPPQFRYGNASNLTASTSKITPSNSLDDDDPTKPVDLLRYFDRRTENLSSTLDLYQRQIREIETHLRTMEAGTLEKAQQLTGSRSSSHDQRKQLVEALKAIEGAILQSASKVGKVRDGVNKQIIGDAGVGLL
ncbi:unnamed protein product [Periconia digitata]|uniref:Nucleoporin NUP49/NSP49 n=1 Tax=Periconia digitata TaxID=1303443 RepID=A0A9W4UUH6_9PLEO|nr:unnamed protein product [Periconia digitata]